MFYFTRSYGIFDTDIEETLIRLPGGADALWVSEKKVKSSDVIVVYCHGGAFIAGNPTAYKGIANKFIDVLQDAHVMMVNYRKCPKYSIQDATQDLAEGVEWLLQNLKITPNQICIAGDSAGGGLVLHLCHNLLHRQVPIRPRCMVMICPYTNLTNQSQSMQSQGEGDPVFKYSYLLDEGRDAALQACGLLATDPAVSSLYLDLRKLPKALICWAAHERLADNSREVVSKLRDQEVPCVALEYAYGIHNFPLLDYVPEYRDYFCRICDFIASSGSE